MARYKCNIGTLLEAKGLKQKELAAAIGATEVSVSRYVNGERIPKATTCIQIANVLDCTVADLYTTERETEAKKSQTQADRIRGMAEQSVREIIESVCEDICDNYCKYRDTADENCECEPIRKGQKCPLDRLQ